jgi:hypothetical protein
VLMYHILSSNGYFIIWNTVLLSVNSYCYKKKTQYNSIQD